MKQIMLIIPPSDYPQTRIPSANGIGLASIASYLEQNRIPFEFKDFFFETIETTVKHIVDSRPYLIGLTCNSDERSIVFRVCERVKKFLPDVKIAVGGHHPTFMDKQILDNFPIDYIVRGEGEKTFYELSKRIIQNKANNKSIRGISYRKGTAFFRNIDRKRVLNMDELDLPYYKGMNKDLYGKISINTTDIYSREIRSLKCELLLLSRGCPYSCSFCSSSSFWKRYRAMSVKKAIELVSVLYKVYGIRYIKFNDDIFTFDRFRIIEFCKKLKESSLEISWECATRIDCVDRQLLEQMKNAGCVNISFGIESASSKVRCNLNKKIENREIFKNFRLMREIGINSKCIIMVGCPGEDIADFSKTAQFINELRPNWGCAGILKVYPGTPLYQHFKIKNNFDESYWLSNKEAPYYNTSLTKKELSSWQTKVNDVLADLEDIQSLR